MTLVRKNHGTGHRYTLDGKPVTGVTTLIKKGFPAPGLINWSGRVVAEYVADTDEQELATLRGLGRDAMITALRALPNQQRNSAAERGQRIHAVAERLSRGETLDYDTDVPEECEGHTRACLAFLDQWQPTPVLTEAVIGNRWVPYAGTLDLVADIPGVGRVLLDYKTGASGIWPETALQLAAYRYADFFLTADNTEMPMAELDISHTWAVWLRADGYDIIPIDTGPDRDHSMAFQTFRAVAYTATRVDAVAATLGETLPVPAVTS